MISSSIYYQWSWNIHPARCLAGNQQQTIALSLHVVWCFLAGLSQAQLCRSQLWLLFPSKMFLRLDAAPE